MKKVDINRNEILKVIYFIIAITQGQTRNSMQGALTSKGDLIGGIFDRWINLIPENLIFNKIILPQLQSNDDIKIITDFYMYDPKKAGIAPDVIGISINGKAIPFAKFNNKWTPVNGMPQIEVKTFKEAQYMVSLRNQNYDGKYLVMAETDLRIDYLVPVFSEDIFKTDVYSQLQMDDSVFIENNNEQLISQASAVNNTNHQLGTVSLLKVTDVESFKEVSNYCGPYTSVQYIKSISESKKKPSGTIINVPLSDICNPHPSNITNLYRFEQDVNCVTLDIAVDKIDALVIVKNNKSSVYIKNISYTEVTFNGIKLNPDSYYKIEYQILDRSSNKGEEYFLQKDLVNYLTDKENFLLQTLNTIIFNTK